jgi:hypothetical protein
MSAKTTTQAVPSLVRLSIIDPETQQFFSFKANCFEIQDAHPTEEEASQILDTLYEVLVPEVKDLVVNAFVNNLFVTYRGEDILYTPQFAVQTSVTKVEPEEGQELEVSPPEEHLEVSAPVPQSAIGLEPDESQPLDSLGQLKEVLEPLNNVLVSEDFNYLDLKAQAILKGEELLTLRERVATLEAELTSLINKLEIVDNLSNYLTNNPKIKTLLKELI